mmetsp:Transcript_37270/g.87681  ORF Transcript_37270/g.87681 Transcript_37270/m.87681 type:complete len:220 (-) Transcript_37270:4830-5489(-)
MEPVGNTPRRVVLPVSTLSETNSSDAPTLRSVSVSELAVVTSVSTSNVNGALSRMRRRTTANGADVWMPIGSVHEMEESETHSTGWQRCRSTEAEITDCEVGSTPKCRPMMVMGPPDSMTGAKAETAVMEGFASAMTRSPRRFPICTTTFHGPLPSGGVTHVSRVALTPTGFRHGTLAMVMERASPLYTDRYRPCTVSCCPPGGTTLDGVNASRSGGSK